MHTHHKYACLLLLAVLISPFLTAQSLRIEPPNWWVGMQNDTLQLLIQGADAGAMTVEVSAKGVTLAGTHIADSPNYLFVDLVIGPDAKPGNIALNFRKDNQIMARRAYELKDRKKEAAAFKGFDASDVICLITPDRFANGNPDNDVVASMRERAIDRKAGFSRHGGDLQGITDHMDYLQSMGFTAVWPSPVLENDMEQWSYHGYAITDYYDVDPRFGTLEDYQAMADAAYQRGIKVIMDQVVNHCGSGHWWMEDLPFNDWLNFQDDPQITNHRRTVFQDPYAAQVDVDLMTGGWFVSTMPDLNQRNPFMSTYLIQNSLWWIETLGLGGIRQDTYPYPDKDFLTRWTCRIMSEYPNFNIVGEEWSTNPNTVAYWQRGHESPDGYESCLPSVMDFPLQTALVSALNEEESWGTGLIKLYENLASDYLYADPKNIMVFAENHDMDRLATQLKGDVAKIKMALAYLLTTRGIPQLYYGSEVLIDNDDAPGDHGIIRTDMPGGWAGDSVNAFTGEGLSDDQRDVQAYLKMLMNWRKVHPVIAKGKTLHFAPRDGTYIYGRYADDIGDTVVVVMNKNAEAAEIDLSYYTELLGDATQKRAPGEGDFSALGSTLSVPPMSVTILEVR